MSGEYCTTSLLSTIRQQLLYFLVLVSGLGIDIPARCHFISETEAPSKEFSNTRNAMETMLLTLPFDPQLCSSTGDSIIITWES